MLVVGCFLVVAGVAMLVVGLRGREEPTPGSHLQAHFITSQSTDEQELDSKEKDTELNASKISRDSLVEDTKGDHGINS